MAPYSCSSSQFWTIQISLIYKFNSETGKYICDVCQTSFDEKSKLSEHALNAHNKVEFKIIK